MQFLDKIHTVFTATLKEGKLEYIEWQYSNATKYLSYVPLQPYTHVFLAIFPNLIFDIRVLGVKLGGRSPRLLKPWL